MRRLKNLQVELTSILCGEMKPANEEAIVIKNQNYLKSVEIEKFDEIEGILECVVYRANKVDSQGDWIDNEELEKACEWNLDYLIKQGKNSPSDVNHNFELAEGVYLKQTYIDKSEDDWVWRQKIDIKENESLMEQAKSKEITGVSLAGRAQEIEEESKMIKMVKEIYDKLFKTKQEKDMKKELEEFLSTDEGIKELEEMGYKKETPEEPKEEQKSETQEEPEMIEKAEFDTIKEQVETLKSQVADLEKEKQELIELNVVEKNESEEQKKTFDEMFEEKMEKMMKKYEVKHGN